MPGRAPSLLEDRLAWLTAEIRASGHVSIAAAAARLSVSEMTIRRDLAELEEQGVARRVRGGARAVGPLTFAQRRDRMARAKSRVAAKLQQFLPATGAVAVDASSTVLRAVAAMPRARDLLVLTNGLDTFAGLQQQAGVTPLLTGGRLDVRTGSLVGPLAERSAQQLATRRFVMSAAAVHTRFGPSEETLADAEVKRAFASAADEVVLAVDSSKLDARALAVGVDWDRVDVLVTELDPTDDRLATYRALAEVR
jgi:DeoR family fructose operon transcriptional repressor